MPSIFFKVFIFSSLQKLLPEVGTMDITLMTMQPIIVGFGSMTTTTVESAKKYGLDLVGTMVIGLMMRPDIIGGITTIITIMAITMAAGITVDIMAAGIMVDIMAAGIMAVDMAAAGIMVEGIVKGDGLANFYMPAWRERMNSYRPAYVLQSSSVYLKLLLPQ